MRKTWMLILAVFLLVAFSAPAFANGVEFAPGFEFAPGLGTYPVTIQGATLPQAAIVDDAGDTYPVTLTTADQSRSQGVTIGLVLPGAKMWGFEFRPFGDALFAPNGDGLGVANAELYSFGALVRRQMHGKWTMDFGYGQTTANVNARLSDPIGAARDADPGIELGGTVIPTGTSVLGETTVKAHEVFVSANYQVFESARLSLSLHQMFSPTGGQWKYSMDGSDYNFTQLPPARLEGTALTFSFVALI